MNKKSTFALYFGNRGFFPASLQASAREELTSVLRARGHEVVTLAADATRNGAVETVEEGRKYARFLHENKGKYDGVILVLPNFGDENGAMAAFRECGVPILIHAYPDDLDKMAPELRRDSFCGKLSIMDVFRQCGIRFTALKPHTAAPRGKAFAANLDHFDRLCRTVKACRNLTVGVIGARSTPFKTVRFDEIALQAHGITTETFDMSELFDRVDKLPESDARVKAKKDVLGKYADWSPAPPTALANLARAGAAIDDMIAEYGLDCVAVRCWTEIQSRLKVSPCVLLSELTNRGYAAACETDVGNAVFMHALTAAADSPATCLDWNNNYADDENKCILFHCGPVPASMMTGKGVIADHAILANSLGANCSFGCNTGRIKPGPMTYGSLLTREGRLQTVIGEAEFTADPVPADFFGCAGVAAFPDLQELLLHLGYEGYRHHVSVVAEKVMAPVADAFDTYLGYETTRF